MSNDKARCILDAARDVIQRYGVKKTSLDDIARQAGIAKATIYYYFDNKEQLLAVLLGDQSREFLALLSEGVRKTAGPVERIAVFFRLRLERFHKMMPLFATLERDSAELPPQVEQVRREYLEEETRILAGVLTEGVRSNLFAIRDPNYLARALTTSMRALEAQSLVSATKQSTKDNQKALLDFLLHGLLRPKAENA